MSPDSISAKSNKRVWWKCYKGHEWITSIANRTKGTACPICSNRTVLSGYNDLQTVNPILASEWNYEKNGSLLPDMFTQCSGKKVWWKCSKGHEWETTIDNRFKGTGCPFCSNITVLSGFNDLQTTNPVLASEWNYKKNKTLSPSMFTQNSGKKVWWKCSKGHEWEATIGNRSKGTGCPICSNRIVLPGYNDLQTVNPALANEWNYERNGNMLPTNFLPNSGKTVWWKCSKGHEWEATLNKRSSGRGCPICANDARRKVNSKPVMCVETEIVYSSAKEASRKTGIFASTISQCCNGKQQTSGGYH